MSYSRRALSRLALGLSTLAVMACLSACATHRPESQGASSAAASESEASPATPPRRNVSRAALVPSKPQKNKPAAPAAAAQELSKTDKIIRSVRQGTLVRESNDLLVFARLEPAKTPENSLYEDAITLARLRRQLNSVDGLPAAVSATATVRNATAYIKLNEELPAETSARAIDSALKTGDIGAVYAHLLGAVRL